MAEKPPKGPNDDGRSLFEKHGPIRAPRDIGEPSERSQEADILELTDVVPDSENGSNVFDIRTGKRFSPDTFKPGAVERHPDETLPEYRTRLKSALKTSVAGIQIRGVDTSKFSVNIPRTSEMAKENKEPADGQQAESEPRKDRKRTGAREKQPTTLPVPVGKLRTEGAANHNENLEYLGPIPSGRKSNLASGMEAARTDSGVTDAQDAYFTELKKYQKERWGIGIAAEDFTGDLSTKKLKELRREWVRSRAALARTQLESADERLKNRPTSREKVLEDLQNYKGKGHFTPEEIKARYERLVTIRSTVLGAEEAENQARIEGLSSREKGAFDTALAWYKKQPKWARIAGTSALLFAGSAGLSTLAGSGVVLGGLLFAGTRTGARVIAETKKGTVHGTTASALAKVLAIGALVGAASDVATGLGHSVLGTEKKAEKLLAKKEQLGDLSDEKSFENLSKSRKQALGAGQRVQRHRRIARTVGSIVGGSIFGHFWHGHDAPQSAGGSETENLTNTPGSVGSGEALSHATGGSSGVHAEELSIHGKVFDADRLFGHFRDQLAKEYQDVSKAPPAIRTLLEHKGSQDDLTKWLGFQGKDGVSAMMHEGDTVRIEPNGELIFRTASGHTETLIDAQGNLHTFDLTKFHTTQIEHPQHVARATAAPESTADTSATSKTESANDNPTIATDSSANGNGASSADSNSSSADSSANDNDSIEYPPESAYTLKPEGSDPSVGPTPGLMPAEGEPGANGIGDLNDLQPGQSGSSMNTIASMRVSPTEAPDPRGIGDLNDLQTPGAGADSLLTNIHHVPLELDSAHEYVWKLPDADTERLFAFGGTPDASAEMAHEFAATNPPGSVMFFVTEKHNLLGMVESRHVSAWFTNEKGKPEFVDEALDSAGKPLPVPDTNDFTRLIK